MGILEMDFERILGVTFFHGNSHTITLGAMIREGRYLTQRPDRQPGGWQRG